MKASEGRSFRYRIIRVYPIFTLGFYLVLYASMSVVAAQDNYLDAIDAEAEKVAPGAGGGKLQGAPGSGAVQPPTMGEGSIRQLTQKEFEQNLSDNFHGSYTFYKKLPGPTKEEIFDSYVRGASMQAIRKKILNRFLKH